jgi:hypothetical protein
VISEGISHRYPKYKCSSLVLNRLCTEVGYPFSLLAYAWQEIEEQMVYLVSWGWREVGSAEVTNKMVTLGFSWLLFCKKILMYLMFTIVQLADQSHSVSCQLCFI